MLELRLLGLILCFSHVLSQCDDELDRKYKTQIGRAKDGYSDFLDDVIEEYGDTDKAEDEIDKLDEWHKQFKDLLVDLSKLNGDATKSNGIMSNKLDDLSDILNNMKNTFEGFAGKDLSPKADILVDIRTKMGPDLDTMEKVLNEWITFLNYVNQDIWTNITNIPHSINDGIQLLEKLVTNRKNKEASCGFDDGRINQVAKMILDIKAVLNDRLRKQATFEKRFADKILGETEEIIRKYRLAKRICKLARNIEELDRLIQEAQVEKLREYIREEIRITDSANINKHVDCYLEFLAYCSYNNGKRHDPSPECDTIIKNAAAGNSTTL